MDLILTDNAITVQEYFSREDTSLVLHSIKTDVTTSIALSLNQGAEITKVAKPLNFVPVNNCDIKVGNTPCGTRLLYQ